jgi:hypothetical protein
MYDWRTMLKNCHASVTVEEQSGDLAISTTEENIERVHAMVLNN